MLNLKHQNIAGSMITVTATSGNIWDLINTAAGTSLKFAGFDINKANGIDIVPISGDIVFQEDGNTPTATEGQPLDVGYAYLGRNISLTNLNLISKDGSNVSVYVQPGFCNSYEGTTITASGVDASQLITSSAPTYASVSMSSADTEYTYTLPSAAKSLEMRLDIDSTADFKLNIGGGAGDSATSYIPVQDNEMYWRQNLDLAAGTVLRFQSPSASQTMRIVIYS